MNLYSYIANKNMVGYKLCNLQYRNEVDADNRYKKAPICMEVIGDLPLSKFMELADKDSFTYEDRFK